MCKSDCSICLTAPCKECAEKPIILCINCTLFRDAPNVQLGGICMRAIGTAGIKGYMDGCRQGVPPKID